MVRLSRPDRPARVPFRTAVALTVAAALVTPAALADILVTAEAPGVQQTQVSGVTTVNFNPPTYKAKAYTSLSTPIGTYTSANPGFVVVAADAYGGANASNYMSVGAQSGTTQATLTLSQSANYFGLFWMAGDTNNNLDFYSGSTLVASMNLSSLLSFIASNPSLYNAYYGNPNNGQDTAEPFAYLNFYGQNGTTFNKIVFRNADTSTGFETDNHSVATLSGTVTPSGTTVTRIGTPEPSSWAIGLVVAGAAGVVAWKRRGAEPGRPGSESPPPGTDP